MDILSNKNITNIFQPAPVSNVIRTVVNRVSKVVGFFSLTDEDRLTAGIDIDGEGREDQTNPIDNSPI